MSILTNIKKAIQNRSAGRQEKVSRAWFMDMLKGMKTNRKAILGDSELISTSNVTIGSMYLYEYDAKHKDTLPYWDQFPLIILIGVNPNGFSGLNLHYLPPVMRARFLDKLMETASNKNLTDSTKMRITYELLQGTSKYKEFAPCHKNYLFSQVRSTLKKVPAEYWEMVSFLPVEKFIGESKLKVWQESRKSIYKRKKR